MRKFTFILSIFFFSITSQAQTWNGIGVQVPTFRYGKVLIGTDEIPTSEMLGNEDITNYKLFVCGGILAEEWLVPNATWCDYVFQPSYYLTPLPEVEQHIQDKGHLHKTPSAAEIESKGLKMQEITINQQEKIEELFLHLIEMEKRMKELEREIEQLRGQKQDSQD
ncbi:MAG: hypothetical protein AAF806_02545 [Bacteroidota bacterium]